ncbi:CPBP family glutamic-type intramembrane protease [Sinomonas mesophila]|uniref:CPBP family glutamic-type intramembrane protease n=1 Tax=Sinomonas mesophila TaxID=1531955 RepID=UPI0009852439|nr:CPBP family glutamic-type intramembrane protease [Sinomonas mesophila]
MVKGTAQGTEAPPRVRPTAVAAAALVTGSAVLLYALRAPLPGYAVMAAGLALAALTDRALARSLALIATGLVIVSTISVEADISYPNMALMGIVLSLAVAVPYIVSRHVFRERAIGFPWRGDHAWTRAQWAYLVLVVALAWLILPFYFITSGAYRNWPAVAAPDEIARLFVGVNAVGIWDELFFVCTVYVLLRRHFPDWLANLLQAVAFVAFLWELGYREWGPALTIPFALLQAFTFSITRSLAYVVAVHLLFDLVVFLVIVHAHHPGTLPIFLL